MSCPLSGVMRVRHAPSAHLSTHSTGRLPLKESFAVVGAGAPLPLAVRELPGGGLGVEAGGASLALSFNPLGWTFGQGRARCVEVHGDAQVGYPVPLYRSRLALHAPPGEAYLGFGEKVGPLDKRGMRLTFWNTDVLPHQPDTDPLYASVPFFVGVGARRPGACSWTRAGAPRLTWAWPARTGWSGA